tara:strand:- start:132 stop:392 length:261 start_codon:yes stop_codon:yes gene_type:complete
MPRYRYFCQDCDSHFIVSHLMSEKQEDCAHCHGDNILKALTTPSFVETQRETKEKAGNLTIKHIEEGRQALKDEKRKAQEQEYEPS